MPPKRKPVKRKSLKNPVVRGTKQKQSQSQKVVVNVNTIKSKPRKKSGRGGLPPPSYQHNLAPTFVTQQATDYNPVIGAIASLTSRLQQEPRIQQPVTPLSSATQMANQQAQSMAGVKAEERREGSTAGNFQPLPSQVRTETPPEEPITSKIIFTPKEKRKKKGFKPIVKLGGERKGETPPEEPITSKIIFTPKEKRKKKGFKPIVKLGGERKGETLDITQREADEYKTEQLVPSKEDSGKAEGGGGRPKVFKSSPEVLARSKQQTEERKIKLDLIREAIERGEPITTEERKFVNKTKGTKKIQESLDFVD